MILDDIIKQLSAFLGNFNDDAIDRLHYVYSAVSLSIYLIFITSKQYYGEPIQCVPNSGTEADMIKYMHSICWLNGTYYVEEVGGTIADFTYKRRLNYYQWIIFILIFKVFLFRVPSNIWQFFISLNGFDLTHVTKIIMNKIYQDEYSDGANWQKTQSAIEAIGEHIRMSFLMQKFKPEKRFRGVFAVGDKKDAKKDKLSGDDKARMRENFPNLRTKSVFPLFAPYLAVKLIYLANILFNFWFLSSVFGFDFFTYGYQFVRLLVSGKYQFANKYFPKRSVCFPKVLSKNDENVGTVVCALPINLINEYFYAGYWYWLIALAVLTTASIFYWLLLAVKSYRRNLVLNALQLGPNQNIQLSYTAAIYFNQETSSETVDRVLRDKTGLDLMGNFNLFFNDVCSIDVVFICKLISLNSSSLAFNDVLNHLWEVYLDLDGAKSKEVAHRPIAPVKRPHYLVPIPILSASETAARSENNDSMRRQPSIDTNSPQDEKSKLLANE